MRSVDPAWFVGGTLMVIVVTLLWVGYDGWRQARQIWELTVRVDRLERVVKKGWGDSGMRTQVNLEKPKPF